MPVIKTYNISSADDVKTIFSNVRKNQEQNNYKVYSKEDLMLVRTTDVFPENRVINSLANSNFITKNSMNFLAEAFRFSELPKEVLDSLKTYELAYRSTVHFTENGLVSSHMYGNFDNRPFIILEPLIHQENNIVNFAGQDTFIKGDVTLSNDAIIIMKETDYLKYKEIHPELDTYNIILYNGITKEDKEQYMKNSDNDLAVFDINDERAVVEMALMDLGYTPELIGSHYITSSATSDKVNELNKELATIHNVSYWSNHSNTDDYKMDFEKNIQITNIFNELLLKFILNRHDISIDMLPQPLRYDLYLADYLVNTITLPKIIEDIEAFNKTIEQMQKDKLLPTSEELVNGNVPDIFNTYVDYLSNNNDIKLK